jgi:hypothetical protein
MAQTIQPDMENVFSKSMMANIKKSLILLFGSEKAVQIYQKAAAIFENEIKNMDDRGNKIIRRHLVGTILPSYACYKALLESGINLAESYNIISNELNKLAARAGASMHKFQKIPFTFTLFRIFAKPFMKHNFPRKGWIIVLKENSRKRLAFDMSSCLYCEELQKRDAFELCPAFCETDHAAYDPLSPGIIFKRTGTQAQPGVKVCDFSFEKGKK